MVVYAASLPLGMGLSQSPRVSSPWSVIQPQTLEKLRMSQESNNVSATQCSPISRKLTFSLLAEWISDSDPGASRARHTGDSSHPCHQSCTCPTTVSLALSFHVPQFGNRRQAWNVSKAGIQFFPCSLL